MNTIGRKWVINFGMLCCLSSLLFICQNQLNSKHILSLRHFLYFKFFASLSMNSALLVYQVEILPTHIIPLTSFGSSLYLVLSTFFMDQLSGVSFSFVWLLMLFVFMLICFIIFYGIDIETKKKQFSQILNEFMKKSWNSILKALLVF
jgi:hypothetical protein